MELVKGETLRALLAREPRDLKKILEYLTQAADALAAAHAAGIVHRDFKPDNMMIAAGGYAKVLDFGLAKLRGEPTLAVDQAGLETMSVAGTTPGLVMGTVGYMSPEQAEGRPADHRSDIFSFGCVLYEAVTGARAFAGTSAVDTLHRIIHSDPARWRRCCPARRRICSASCASAWRRIPTSASSRCAKRRSICATCAGSSTRGR